uniref:DNA-directed RNA polymerase subunit n=1 Tax=Teucrium mascatense TaxID=2172029 RepID=A0A4Y6I4D3_9LAMI|nr:RNA polymerase beta [Teucrium mascatense]QDF64436.1 RNA polymerase beta [Teucrium mascatense]
MNPNFYSMIDRHKHQQLRIGLVSSQQISAWATKILPNGEIVGEVTKPSTFHYKTNKPEKDGLFCERIFGPIKSGICACGNYRVIGDEKEDPKFCEQCGVEFVDSRIRRYQMGYIKLACPVTHVWYLKRLPSFIANLLDKPLKELEGLVYCDVIFLLLGPKRKNPLSYDYEVYSNMKSNLGNTASRIFLLPEASIHFAIEKSLPVQVLFENNKPIKIYALFYIIRWENGKNEGKRSPQGMNGKIEGFEEERIFWLDACNWLSIFFEQIKNQNGWFCVYYQFFLLSKDPSFRKMGVNKKAQILMNFIEELSIGTILLPIYKQKVDMRQETKKCVRRNKYKKPWIHFLDNGIRGTTNEGWPKKGLTNRFPMKLKASKINFVRLSLANGSIIQDVPSLSKVLHFHYIDVDCRAKKQLELFQTFVIRGLLRQHLASNIGVAKSKIREKELIVWEILQEVMQGHPVLLNRAPTLHKFGIQAFQPILVEGHAICLHPLVCKGFNADFDGDQMAVHVPLSLEAQAEARLLMFSHMNLLSPAIGDPISVPTQDMLIGLYVLTIGNRRGICINRYNPWNPKNYQNKRSDNNKYTKEPFFSNSYDAIGAYWQKRINLDSPLWLRWRLDQRVIASRETPIEVHYESLGNYYEIYGHYLIVRNIKKEFLFLYIRTTVGHISLYREIEEAIQGFSQVCSYGT